MFNDSVPCTCTANIINSLPIISDHIKRLPLYLQNKDSLNFVITQADCSHTIYTKKTKINSNKTENNKNELANEFIHDHKKSSVH